MMNDQPLTIMITGSRQWKNSKPIHNIIKLMELTFGTENIVFIHGACPSGVDFIVDKYCQDNDITVKKFPPDYLRYGSPRAQWIRNKAMIAENPDIVIAFPLGKSPGTRGTIALAERTGIPVFTIEGSNFHDR